MEKSKKLLAIILLFPAIAGAVCNPFVANTVLTASALNAAIAAPCITSGSITGATITASTLDSTAVGSSFPAVGTFFTLNAQSGVNASGIFSGTYVDGTVVDYTTGNGRISVGVNDTLTLYASGVANTQMEQVSLTGTTMIGAKLGTSGAGKLLFNSTAPTIQSGFGTSPSVISSNGSSTYQINVGAGGTASSGVVTMPTATTGWNCNVDPVSAPQAAATMYSVPTTASSVTITNYTQSTGVALAWPASMVIAVSCIGY